MLERSQLVFPLSPSRLYFRSETFLSPLPRPLPRTSCSCLPSALQFSQICIPELSVETAEEGEEPVIRTTDIDSSALKGHIRILENNP